MGADGPNGECARGAARKAYTRALNAALSCGVEDETPAAICELTGVHMDTAMRKSTPFPPAIREKAAALIAAAGA